VRAAPPRRRRTQRAARSTILAQAEQLARAGAALQPQLSKVDPTLLGHTMLSFAEMLGRLAITDPDSYPPERLERFATDAMALLAGDRP
jgi:hypothetical protein